MVDRPSDISSGEAGTATIKLRAIYLLKVNNNFSIDKQSMTSIIHNGSNMISFSAARVLCCVSY